MSLAASTCTELDELRRELELDDELWMIFGPAALAAAREPSMSESKTDLPPALLPNHEDLEAGRLFDRARAANASSAEAELPTRAATTVDPNFSFFSGWFERERRRVFPGLFCYFCTTTTGRSRASAQRVMSWTCTCCICVRFPFRKAQ